ncbi:hypothetical protein [Candidatus Stoquefichus massiliensis]|uniref:hypothetical protein n=1 Tax=Candidatus Stoquefichus massiliensis TaxID=1470350 RepID=UPI000485BD98|nr:hypothetical protein [Candidatus Stoquefichus massiliensis]
MGLFSKKKAAIDYDAVFKEQYKSINQLLQQAHQEMDYVIKESLYELIVEKYRELIELINQGASFDKDHFVALMDNAQKELTMIHQMNKDV